MVFLQTFTGMAVFFFYSGVTFPRRLVIIQAVVGTVSRTPIKEIRTSIISATKILLFIIVPSE